MIQARSSAKAPSRIGAALAGGAFALFATPALADTCAALRPGWTAGTPATALNEALFMLNAPEGLLALAVFGVILLTRTLFVAIAGAVFVFARAAVRLFEHVSPDERMEQAVAQGCVGAPWLSIAVLFAMGFLMIVIAKTKPSRKAG